MKRTKLTAIILTAVTAAAITAPAYAAPIPRESAPVNATEEQIQITENIIGGVLDEVYNGMGYAAARGKANTLVREAVIAGGTNGHGYGILSPIAQNAILSIRDIYLRPEVYAQAEEELKVLLADILLEVANGKDIAEAQKEAYILIYKSKDASFDPNNYTGIDTCYQPDLPTVDRVYFNRARKLIYEAGE